MAALPSPFAALEAFVADWALPTEDQRSRRRWACGPDDFQAFYDAMLPRLDEVLAHLDQYALDDIPADARRLFRLGLAFAEMAAHIELYGGATKVPNSFDQSRFIATHGNVME